jgi:hypothetical protein
MDRFTSFKAPADEEKGFFAKYVTFYNLLFCLIPMLWLPFGASETLKDHLELCQH